MKLLMWFTVVLNLFSATLGLFGGNDDWSINLITACVVYILYRENGEQ